MERGPSRRTIPVLTLASMDGPCAMVKGDHPKGGIFIFLRAPPPSAEAIDTVETRPINYAVAHRHGGREGKGSCIL